MMEISKEVWREIALILQEHKIPYTSYLKSRDIPAPMEECEKAVQDRYIQINLVILDYFNEVSRC